MTVSRGKLLDPGGPGRCISCSPQRQPPPRPGTAPIQLAAVRFGTVRSDQLELWSKHAGSPFTQTCLLGLLIRLLQAPHQPFDSGQCVRSSLNCGASMPDHLSRRHASLDCLSDSCKRRISTFRHVHAVPQDARARRSAPGVPSSGSPLCPAELFVN